MITTTISIPSLGSTVRYQPGWTARGFPAQMLEVEADQELVDEIIAIFRSSGFKVPTHTLSDIQDAVSSRETDLEDHHRNALEEARDESFEAGYRRALADLNMEDPR